MSLFGTVRQATLALCENLTDEDCVVQSMPNCSPAKWHLAHTTWFFETFVLERLVPEYQWFHRDFRVLFNSYYNTVGTQYPRPRRGLLTRPDRRDVLAYRNYVDDWIRRLLDSKTPLAPETLSVIELGCHHEQQHQELLLTDIKHLFSCNPLAPAYRDLPPENPVKASDLKWLNYEEGLQWVGFADEGFCFDNETPRHRVFLEAFALASRLVTCGEYLDFMEDGGYDRPELWLSNGWDTIQSQEWRSPLYWQLDGNHVWKLYTLSGSRELNREEPVGHISFYEADAYARWAGARLPTETEWEHVASSIAVAGNLLENKLFHPVPSNSVARFPDQMFGDLWEWTHSPYTPYPGFHPAKGAIGEYNGKFMCNQMVLRGGSCVTPQSHIRASYRNFFPPETRWQFSGIRLARWQ